jgi:uncharacterized protein (TIGR03435 family)
VKAAPPRTGEARLVAMDTDPAMIRYANISLKNLIAMAYRYDSRRIQGGPDWLDTQMYDVAAKLPPGVSKEQVPEMLQDLLAERFKLALHRETKEQRVYFLVAGKGGPKLKEVPAPDPQDAQQVRGARLPMQMMRGRIIGHAVPVGMLAGALAQMTGHQVVDRTGLTKNYDIDLHWTAAEDSEIFAALQEQLGLKLEAGRGPVEVIVIDRAERNPEAN